MKMTSNNWPFPQKNYMNFFGDCSNDLKPEMITGVQIVTGIPHDEYDIRGIAHARSAQTEKTTFSCKDDQCKTLHIYWSGGKVQVHSRSTHSAGHVPLCGIFTVTPASMVLSHVGIVLQNKFCFSWCPRKFQKWKFFGGSFL